MPFSRIDIDGAQGEGGGQILRTALALSLLTRRAIRMTNIRAGRRNPGLAPQHLKAVEAAAQIGNAQIQGTYLGSRTLEFIPQGLFPGSYQVDIGTAGSTGLILQTLLLPLSFTPAVSRLVVRGGTHVPWSPCHHYLKRHWLPYFREMGGEVELHMEGAGYYPRGGGLVRCLVQPLRRLSPLNLTQRGNLEQLSCLSLATGLARQVAQRQADQAARRLKRFRRILNVEVGDLGGVGKGTMLLLLAEFEGSRCCYCSLGAHGKSAESVADETVDALERFLSRKGAIDEHLADQLVLPLCLAEGVSEFTTAAITRHLLTNIATVKLFLPLDISVTGALGDVGRVCIRGGAALG